VVSCNILLAGCADQKSASIRNIRGIEGVSSGTNYLDYNHDGQPDLMSVGISLTQAELSVQYKTNWIKVYSGAGVQHMPTDLKGNPWTKSLGNITTTEYVFADGQWAEIQTGHETNNFKPERTTR